MRAPLLLATLLIAAGAAAALAQDRSVEGERARLALARTEADQARARAVRLEREAARARDDAEAARAREAAVAARIQGFAADLTAAEARVAILAALEDRHRRELATGQGPLVRLMAALQSLARRPAETALVQPGSVTDIVHVRAALSTVFPAVRQRTEGIRRELDRSHQLRAAAGVAAAALQDSRARLGRERQALAALEQRHRDRARQLGRDVMVEQDRAVALGEEARDIVDQIESSEAATEVQARLETVAGPVARPIAAEPVPTPATAYRLPVLGRLVEGFGEVGRNGVRSRGLTLAPDAGALARVPADGKVVFAGAFRRYGQIVVLDHGAGWTSLVTGLTDLRVATGATLRQGQALGRVAGDRPRVTVELRRRNRPVDIAALLG